MAFNIFNVFRNPSKEQKYSAERGTQYSPTKGETPGDSKKVAGDRYASLVSKMAQREKKPTESQANVDKVESIFGNKGGYKSHKELLEKSKKFRDFSLKEKGNIKYPGHPQYQAEARKKALENFREKYSGDKLYYREKDVKVALDKARKDANNPYLEGGKPARDALKEQAEFLEKFYGLSSS